MATSRFRFLHCADLRLGAPPRGLHWVEPPLTEVLGEATFAALDRVVEAALAQRVEMVLFVGNILAPGLPTVQAQLRFRTALARLSAAGIGWCAAHGRDDPFEAWRIALPAAEGCRRFLPGEAPQRLAVVREGVEIAQLFGISLRPEDAESPWRRFPPMAGPMPAVAVAAADVGGQGPVSAAIEELLPLGADYWALGGRMQPEVVRPAQPAIVYPGTAQGLAPPETGPHGCVLVEFDDARRPHLTRLETDVVRWHDLAVEVTRLGRMDALLGRLSEMQQQLRQEAGGRGTVARVTLTGNGPLHELLQEPQRRQALLEALRQGEAARSDFVWFGALRVATVPGLDLADRRKLKDFAGELLRAADELRRSDDPASALRGLLESRPEYAALAGELRALGDDPLLAALDEAEALGVTYLLENRPPASTTGADPGE